MFLLAEKFSTPSGHRSPKVEDDGRVHYLSPVLPVLRYHLR